MYNGPEHYLDKDAATGRVMAHARLLLKLSRRFEAVAPAGLRHSAHVANYKLGTIIIHADNGAVAAKLRQMATTLANDFCKLGIECNDVQIRVQVSQIPRLARISPQRALSARAGGTLDELSKKLPDSPLRNALETLLTHVRIDKT